MTSKRTVKIVCREASHPKGRESLVERVQFVERYLTCNEGMTADMVVKGLSCADWEPETMWCQECSGHTWRMVGGGHTSERILLSTDDEVSKAEINGSTNRRGKPELIDQTRERWSLVCPDCGLAADVTRSTLEMQLKESVENGVSRILLRDLVARLGKQVR